MPISKAGRTYASRFKTDVSVDQTTNTGFDSTARLLVSGDGASSAVSLSDDQLIVFPQNDSTTSTLRVRTSSGSDILVVDTTNGRVKTGVSQVNATTNQVFFGLNWQDSSGLSADIHHAIPFQASVGNVATGGTAIGSSTSSSFNDTDPATSLTITTSAQYLVMTYWYVMDNITIDEVRWFHAADASAGDSTAAHLMAYTVDTANGSTGGDLSSGVVVADGATITNAGYEQVYYQAMTIQSADVDAGKVILFTFASDTINSDYSINATVKYHIR